jgi:hypothetical protein
MKTIIEHIVSFTKNGLSMEKEFPEDKLAEAQAFAQEVNGTCETYEEEVSETPSQVLPFGEKFDSGYFDETEQVKIKTSKDAQQKFTGAVVMINSALMVGAMTGESPTDFWDYNGQKHTISAGRFIGLMLRYGQFIKSQLEN